MRSDAERAGIGSRSENAGEQYALCMSYLSFC